MKYFLRVLVALIVAVAVILGAYIYMNGGINSLKQEKQNQQQTQTTTVSATKPTTTKVEKKLLASLKDDDFYLYQKGNDVVLTHDGQSTNFTGWSSELYRQKPTMYYANFDDDDDKELLIKGVSSYNETTKKYIYELYLLDISKDDKGKYQYEVTLYSRSTWNTVLQEKITQEVSQLKSNDKFVQFAMTTTDNTISYDKKSGLATKGYAGYASALRNNVGGYYQLDRWSKGDGIYSVDKDNHICIDIEILVNYKDCPQTQSIGSIHFQLSKYSKYVFVTSKSMVFKPAKKYEVSDPRIVGQTKWNYTENNYSATNKNANDKVIDWIKYTPKFSQNTTSQTVYLADEKTEIANISKIEISQKQVKLTAKDGFTFGNNPTKFGDYSVVISNSKLKDVDISSSAKIDKSGKNEILIINLDNSYEKNNIESISINYGAK